MQGARVQSLVGELRSHMPCSVAKKKKKKRVGAHHEKFDQTGKDKDAGKNSSDVTENLPGAGCLA